MTISAALHPKEKERLATLRASQLLDTAPEEVYDRLVRLAAGICETPVALVSLVDETRQWVKAAWGSSVGEMPRSQAFCAHTILHDELLVVENATHDPRFANHELVKGPSHVRFYAGVPLRAAGGLPIGTLCVMDRRARRLGDRQREALCLLAGEVESQIALRRAWLEASELHHRSSGLVAMVVHDMNSPLCVAGTLTSWFLSSKELPEEMRGPIRDIQDAVSSVQRMASDLLDVALGAEGRLQPRLTDTDPAALFGELGHAALLRARLTRHSFVADIRWDGGAFFTDPVWVKRITTNFVENAFKYAPPGTAVRLEVRGGDADPLVVRVRDDGPGVPLEQRGQIFEKHFRLARDQLLGRPGAGLGLAFCKLAVETLGGSLGVETNGAKGSVFWFVLPQKPRAALVPLRYVSAHA
jgi:signal transduction histidine kinase